MRLLEFSGMLRPLLSFQAMYCLQHKSHIGQVVNLKSKSYNAPLYISCKAATLSPPCTA